MNNMVLLLFSIMISSVSVMGNDFFLLTSDRKTQIEGLMKEENDLSKIVMNIYRIRKTDNSFAAISRHQLFPSFLIENFLSQKVQDIPEIKNDIDKSIVAALLLVGTDGGKKLGVPNYIYDHPQALTNFLKQFNYVEHYYSNLTPMPYEYRQHYLETYRKIAQGLVDLNVRYYQKAFDEMYHYAVSINEGNKMPDQSFKPDWKLLNILHKSGMEIVIPEEHTEKIISNISWFKE